MSQQAWNWLLLSLILAVLAQSGQDGNHPSVIAIGYVGGLVAWCFFLASVLV